MNDPKTCQRRLSEDHPCKNCSETCPMAKAFVSAPADWKIWALMAVGVIAAAVIARLVL